MSRSRRSIAPALLAALSAAWWCAAAALGAVPPRDYCADPSHRDGVVCASDSQPPPEHLVRCVAAPLAPIAARWDWKATGRLTGAALKAHYAEVTNRTAAYRAVGKSVGAAGYNGPWIEDVWLQHVGEPLANL